MQCIKNFEGGGLRGSWGWGLRSNFGAPFLYVYVLFWGLKPLLETREGANREKLTVKKIINNEMFFFFFFSPFMSLINREKLCANREKSAPKIHHFFTVSFSPFTSA